LSALRTACVICAAPSGCIIEYDTRLITETDLRVHGPGGGNHFAALEVTQVRGDGGGADVDREPVGALVEAGPHADDLRARVHGHRDLPLTLAQGALQSLQHREVTAQRAEIPLLSQRQQQTLQIAGRIVHVRLAHLDVVQVHHRIERDDVRLGRFAYDLAVHLGVGRHVDDQIPLDTRRARQPMAIGERPAPREALLGLTQWRQVRAAGTHAVLGELALHHQHLAAAAQRASAAHRVDVDTEAARRLQQGCAEREAPALARGREHHQGVGLTHAGLWLRRR
jgi:hypothetical protein